jgi:hypothetical protein
VAEGVTEKPLLLAFMTWARICISRNRRVSQIPDCHWKSGISLVSQPPISHISKWLEIEMDWRSIGDDDDAFQRCKSLQSIVIPDSLHLWEFKKLICNWLFYLCNLVISIARYVFSQIFVDLSMIYWSHILI